MTKREGRGGRSGRTCSRSTRVLLGLFLAMHAARCLGLGMQAGGGDVGAAVCALAIGARFDAGEGGFDSGQVRGFAFAQGKFQFALGGHLGAWVFRLPNVLSRHFGAANWASNSDCWVSNCWRNGAAWVLSMRGLLGVIGYQHGAPVPGAVG